METISNNFILFVTECNCFSHSDVCVFDQRIANQNQSMNVFNVFSGGGVCQNCQHNTTGTNCEQCKTFFYHPINVSLTDQQTCKPCNCNGNGSRNVAGYQYLDCVKDNKILGMSPGDCFCKENVYGKTCDHCKRGFYNLTYSNPEGCDSCRCLINGTVNSSISCIETGQCLCKAYVTNKQCDECRDGYFNLTSQNQYGCHDCLCDLGASVSLACNKTSGICSCHVPQIYGEKCRQIKDGFFYPSIHFITDQDLIRINKIIVAWRGILQIPEKANHSQNIFKIVLKYSSRIHVTGVVSIQDSLYTTQVDVGEACQNCYAITVDSFNLFPGSWNVDIIFPSVTTSNLVQCHEIIGIPQELFSLTSIRNKTQFLQHCDIVSNKMNHSVCKKDAFSITMDYLHTPLNCTCNLIGATDGVCEKAYGQCKCKFGIGGRQCDKCLSGFYNFTNFGCQNCGCLGDHKVCNQSTGQCVCPPNTEGRTCDKCKKFHWDFNSTYGCKQCNCNSKGAVSGECDLFDGQCSCKNGVIGQQCDICRDAFTKLSSDGCVACNCSVIGSTSVTCDKETGHCQCKGLTAGSLCDRCSKSAFDFSSKYESGCQRCFCMNVGYNCTSAKGFFKSKHSPLIQWTFGTYFKKLSSVKLYNETRGSHESPIIMLSAEVVTHDEPLFWRSGEEVFVDVTSYGGFIEFQVEMDFTLTDPVKRKEQAIVLKVSYKFLCVYLLCSIP